MGLAILLNAPVMATFVLITAVCGVVFFALTLTVVAAITYVQTETPPQLLGKVLSLFSMLPFLAQALGQLGFGILFEMFAPWVAIFAAVAMSLAATGYAVNTISPAQPV
jgi:MFS family permease